MSDIAAVVAAAASSRGIGAGNDLVSSSSIKLPSSSHPMVIQSCEEIFWTIPQPSCFFPHLSILNF